MTNQSQTHTTLSSIVLMSLFRQSTTLLCQGSLFIEAISVHWVLRIVTYLCHDTDNNHAWIWYFHTFLKEKYIEVHYSSKVLVSKTFFVFKKYFYSVMMH